MIAAITTNKAAEEFGVCQSRIRQVCIQHDVGTLVEGRRFLSKSDMRKLRRIFEKMRNRS